MRRPAVRLPLACCLLVLAAAAGCSRKPVVPTSKPPPAPPAGPTPLVTVSQPVEREVIDYLEFTGRTAPSEAAEVRAPHTGTLEQVQVRPGDAVRKDQPLFRLDRKPFEVALGEARQALGCLEECLRKADDDLDQARKDLDKGAVSREELDRVAAARGLAAVEAELARAAVRRAEDVLKATQVVAPLDGTVERVFAGAGSPVTAGERVVRIAQTDPLLVSFDVGPSSLLRLRQRLREAGRAGAAAEVPVLLGLANEEGFPHRGAVAAVADQPDAKTGRVTVRATFPNAGRALPAGRSAWLRLPLAEKPYQALLVSDSALVREGTQDGVLVVNGRNVVEFRPVKPGLMYEGLRVIKEGLTKDDWVVVTGMQCARVVTEAQRHQGGVGVEPRRAAMPAAPPTPRIEAP